MVGKAWKEADAGRLDAGHAGTAVQGHPGRIAHSDKPLKHRLKEQSKGRDFLGQASCSDYLTHQRNGDRLYRIWKNMKYRCNTSTCKDFMHYGGRGIKVCTDWNADFEKFQEWALSNGYADNLTIDRIDSNGNYEPSNCRWVTLGFQQRNKRNSSFLTINGRTQLVTQWSEEYGVKYNTIRWRMLHGVTGTDLIRKVVKP